jgi:hypothetical protein
MTMNAVAMIRTARKMRIRQAYDSAVANSLEAPSLLRKVRSRREK